MLTIIPRPVAIIDDKIEVTKVTRKSNKNSLNFWSDEYELPTPYRFTTLSDEMNSIKFKEEVYDGVETIETLLESYDMMYQTSKLPFWNLPIISTKLQNHISLAWRTMFWHLSIVHTLCIASWSVGELINYNSTMSYLVYNAINMVYLFPVLAHVIRTNTMSWFTIIETIYAVLLASCFYDDSNARRVRAALGAVCLQQMLQVYNLPGIGLYDELLHTSFRMLVPIVVSTSVMGVIILAVYPPFMTDPLTTMQVVFNQAVGWKYENLLSPKLNESYILLVLLLLFKMYNIVLFLAGLNRSLTTFIDKSVKASDIIIARERMRFMMPFIYVYRTIFEGNVRAFELRILKRVNDNLISNV